MHSSPLEASAALHSKEMVLLLLVHCLLLLSLCVVVLCLVLIFYTVLSVISRFAIISMGYRELVALFQLSSCCHVAVSFLLLFLTLPWVGLKCVIVSFPVHTHLLFG